MKTLVAEVLASLGQARRLEEARLILAWERIVGPQVAARTFPLRLASGVLTVAVHNSVWLSQLQFFRQEMAAKAGRFLGEGAVSSVRLQLGPRPWPAAAAAPRQPLRRKPSLEEARQIEEACSRVGDGELRELLLRVLTKQACLDRERPRAKAQPRGREDSPTS